MKTVIASTHCSRTDLIDIQYKTLRKFIEGEYDYYVFNDAMDCASIINFNNANIGNEIHEKCKELGVKCIDVPQYMHTNRKLYLFPNTEVPKNIVDAGTRCADATQFVYNYFCEQKDIFLIIIDADMFPIDYINLSELQKYDISYVPQYREKGTIEKGIKYIWNALVFLNTNALKPLDRLDFDAGRVFGEPVDVGGQTHFWLEKYKTLGNSLTMYEIDCINITPENYLTDGWIKNTHLLEYCEKMSKTFGKVQKELLFNSKLFHMRGWGGNWNYGEPNFREYVAKKYKKFPELDILENEWKIYQYENAKLIYDFVDSLFSST